MSARTPDNAMSRRDFVTLLASLTTTHTLGTVIAFTLTAVSPVAAQDYGVPVYMIGYQASLIGLGIIIALAFGGNLSLRWGATRVNQAGISLMAAGAALATIPSIAVLIPASVAMGIGYGAMTPSASHILIRFTPPDRTNVVFSIKQTGVPLGGVLAATIMPPLTVVAGWRVGLWAVAIAAIGMALLLERWRGRWDDDRKPSTPLAASPLRAVGLVWRRGSLRMMAFAGACIVAAQICIQSYTVPMFYEQFAMTLVEAGWMLTVSQLGGVMGRLFWGWLADRWGDSLKALTVLAVTLALATVCVGTLTLGWPRMLAYILFFIFGATASGWNGAFLGQVARAAPPGQVSMATGGSLFFVNVASIAAPLVFASVFSATRSYSFTFALLTLTAVAAIACLLRARRLEQGAAQ